MCQHRLLVLITAILVNICAIQARAQNTSTDILRESHKMITEIRSIEFQASRMGIMRPLPSSMPAEESNSSKTFDLGYLCYSSGSFYRINGKSGQDRDVVTAFNGTHYQYFIPDIRLLSKSSTKADGPAAPFPSPIDWTYYWLAPNTVLVTSLHDPNRWEIAESKAKLIGEKVVNSTVCSVVEIQQSFSSGDFLYRVMFAKNLRGLPLGWECYKLPERSFVGSCTVKKFEIVNSGDGGPIYIPVEVETNFAAIGTPRHYTIDSDTLKVNHAISDDIFTLSTATAEYVHDVDAIKKKEESKLE